jgi:hypothetical protein
MQIQNNTDAMDHPLILALCSHTKLLRIKMIHKCIPKLNGECVGDQLIDDWLFNHDGLDAIDLFFQN